MATADIDSWQEDVVVLTETGWARTAEETRRINNDWLEVSDGLKNEAGKEKSNCRGVAIMIRTDRGVKLVQSKRSGSGNWVAAELDVGSKANLLIVGIYAPSDRATNKDEYRKFFHEDFTKWMSSWRTKKKTTMIIVGDNIGGSKEEDERDEWGIRDWARKWGVQDVGEMEGVDTDTYIREGQERGSRIDRFYIEPDIDILEYKVEELKKGRDHREVKISLDLDLDIQVKEGSKRIGWPEMADDKNWTKYWERWQDEKEKGPIENIWERMAQIGKEVFGEKERRSVPGIRTKRQQWAKRYGDLESVRGMLQPGTEIWVAPGDIYAFREGMMPSSSMPRGSSSVSVVRTVRKRAMSSLKISVTDSSSQRSPK